MSIDIRIIMTVLFLVMFYVVNLRKNAGGPFDFVTPGLYLLNIIGYMTFWIIYLAIK